MAYIDIVSGIEKLLELNKDGLQGSLHQEPYKGDYFRLFAAAFNGGFIESPTQHDYLSADALSHAIEARNPDLLQTEAWNNLHRFWSDWTYAWKNAHMLKQR